MLPRSFLPLLVFSLLLFAGCASSAPQDPGASSDSPGPPAMDSTQHAETTPPAGPAPDREKSVTALRRAYLEGAYGAVVQRARDLRDDSLPASEAIQLNTLLGRAEQARGRHEAAIEALQQARRRAYEEDQSLAHLDRALGESYAALYRWPQAASAFQRVLDDRPTDRAVRQALAQVYRRSQNWNDAQQQYTWLVRADSSNGRWWAQLAQCDVQLGETGQAVRHFSEAHQLLPQSADVALSLSRFYRATQRLDAARRVVDTTLTYQPADPRLWRRQADLAFDQDDLDDARRAYRRAITTGDSSATAFRRIGLIDVQQQEYARALSSLRQSLRRDSTHPRTTLYLGISHLRLDSLELASSFLERTIDLEAEGPITKAFVHRGTVSNRRGEVTAAVKAYRTALRLQPERTDVYFQLATVYDEHYREKRTAARHYRQFLRVSDSTRPRLRTYARDRLETLRPTLHMEEERIRTSDTTGK